MMLCSQILTFSACSVGDVQYLLTSAVQPIHLNFGCLPLTKIKSEMYTSGKLNLVWLRLLYSVPL